MSALNQVPDMTPTHWGPDERARLSYEASSFLAAVSSYTADGNTPGLHRRVPPRYQAYFSAANAGLKTLKIEFGAVSVQETERIFALGDALTLALEPELGLIHPIWQRGAESQEYSAAGIVTAQKIQRFGLRPPCARTWYGDYLTALIGRELLQTSGALVSDRVGGGMQLDLTEQVWQADYAALSAQQRHVMQTLQMSGVFGDYSDPIRPQPAPAWRPIPLLNMAGVL